MSATTRNLSPTYPKPTSGTEINCESATQSLLINCQSSLTFCNMYGGVICSCKLISELCKHASILLLNPVQPCHCVQKQSAPTHPTAIHPPLVTTAPYHNHTTVSATLVGNNTTTLCFYYHYDVLSSRMQPSMSEWR